MVWRTDWDKFDQARADLWQVIVRTLRLQQILDWLVKRSRP